MGSAHAYLVGLRKALRSCLKKVTAKRNRVFSLVAYGS